MRPLQAACLLLAGPVGAQTIAPTAEMLICDYTTECHETEACQGAGHSHDVALPGAPSGIAAFLLDTGPAEGAMRMVKDTLVVTGADENAAYMLIAGPDGAARLSVQIADPLSVVTYHGTCRVPE